MLLNFFGAPEIPLSMADLEKLASSEVTPPIIVYAVPAMVFFTIIEIIAAYKQHKEYYTLNETVGSVGVGLGNLFINAALKLFLMFPIVWIYNLVPWRMEFSWWTFLPCYILYDFCSYWAHRISHEQRFWWATHIAHHSGEKYNLAVSFRLSWVQQLKIVFFLPCEFLGFHPVIFFITNQIAVLFQFWVHTEYIRKLHPVIEYIFATPSNHRVHHGTQEQYLDKNYGATFIIWDRWFGTYEPEGEEVVYGLTENIDKKANPIHINFHEYADIWKDVKNAKGFRKKFFYLFGSPYKIGVEKKNMREAELKRLQKEQKVLITSQYIREQELESA